MFKIYSNQNCARCEKVFELLDKYNKKYEKVVIGEDTSIEEFKSEFPFVNILPVILKDGLRMSNIDELRESIESEQKTYDIRFHSEL
jgi:arsenate reductase-like glutaredoxin family protein